MRHIITLIKGLGFSIIILLLGQIPVQGRRISDHVFDASHSALVQKPIRFVSSKLHFDATRTSGINKKGSGIQNDEEQP